MKKKSKIFKLLQSCNWWWRCRKSKHGAKHREIERKPLKTCCQKGKSNVTSSNIVSAYCFLTSVEQWGKVLNFMRLSLFCFYEPTCKYIFFLFPLSDSMNQFQFPERKMRPSGDIRMAAINYVSSTCILQNSKFASKHPQFLPLFTVAPTVTRIWIRKLKSNDFQASFRLREITIKVKSQRKQKKIFIQ